MMTRWLHAGLGLALLSTPCGGLSAQDVSRGELTLEPCSFPRVEENVFCATMSVPEHRSAPGGREIELRVAVLPAQEGVTGDPVFLIQGGPGGATTDLIRLMQNHPGRAGRDFVFVDQRGTGASNPLHCPSVPGPGGPSPAMWARGCAPRLDADLTQYGTTVAVHDLDAVRATMGYEALNVMGGSYGSRVALEYLRRYPERTRSLVLDAMVGPGRYTGSEMPASAQHALDGWFGECASDAACSEAYPDSRGQLDGILATLEVGPATLTMRGPSGRTREMEVGPDMIQNSIFMMLYRSRTAVTIPWAIDQAAQGNYSAFMSAGIQQPAEGPPGGEGNARRGQPGPGVGGQVRRAPGGAGGNPQRRPGSPGGPGGTPPMAVGMMMTIFCNEDLPFIDVAEATERAKESFLGNAQLDEMARTCEEWPKGDIPRDFHAPISSDVPTLIFAGEWDPAIPPDEPARVAGQLDQSVVVTMPKSGHTSLSTSCNQSIAAVFLDRGSVAGLDTSCAAEMERPPFKLPGS